MTTSLTLPEKNAWRLRARSLTWAALCTLVVAASGCVSGRDFLDKITPAMFKAEENLPAPADGIVLTNGTISKEASLKPGTPEYRLAGAKRLFQDKKYADAERVFHRLARNGKTSPLVAEEALYYEAESQYWQQNYRDAKGTYTKLLKNYRASGRFHDQATRRMFDIANYWLDDTRQQMRAYDENSWFVMPVSTVSFTKKKPLTDTEGHALQALEEVRLNDIKGPLGEKSLWYIATVKFYRRDFHDADYYYSQLYENYPNSELASKAIKQAIICKRMITGGPSYDGQPVEEARKLIDVAARAYPELSHGKDKFLEQQLVAISTHQADRDFNIAKFYERIGHPGSAYFYYELVRRRYPNSEHADKAVERMREIRDRAQQMPEQPQTMEPQPPGPLQKMLMGTWKSVTSLAP